jgi:anaerobic magnesium-protoporphyrin IX monomethyl ester cyclase
MFQPDIADILTQPKPTVAKTGEGKGLRTLLLNLPYPTRIIRRYMCSYNAPNFLFPPLELISLGAILKEWEKDEVELYDAIAKGADLDETNKYIAQYQPDIIIAITGFEIFDHDMDMVRGIKEHNPNSKIVLFGHYATQFTQEVMERVPVDIIIQGEPDLIFAEAYKKIKAGESLKDVKGIAYRTKDGEIVLQQGNLRLPDPSVLPMPAYDMLEQGAYFEPFLPKPFGMIQSARGCPYQCNYCVKSFGTKLTTRTPEQIVDEIKELKRLFGIKSLRFIDDTFTVIPSRVIAICKLMIEEKVDVQWSCLSRADTLNEEMLIWMKKAGCKRVYIGVESGSQRILDFYKKKVNVEEALANIKLCKKIGVETMGFFIVGMPEETREDFDLTLKFAKKSDLTFAIVFELVPYPGTPLFPLMKDKINFSLMPYKNEYKDPELRERFHKWEKEFYFKFYFRPKYIAQSVTRVLSKPIETISSALKLFKFILLPQNSNRKDFI